MDALDCVIVALLIVLIIVVLRRGSGYADIPSGATVLADSTGITPKGSPVPVLNQPTINTGGPVQFTLAFKINITDSAERILERDYSECVGTFMGERRQNSPPPTRLSYLFSLISRCERAKLGASWIRGLQNAR
jgi:hypothetical protein